MRVSLVKERAEYFRDASADLDHDPCEVSTRRGGVLQIVIKLHKLTELTTQIDVSSLTTVGNITAVNSWSVNAESGGISG
jgi:hypothetical protein